MVRVHPTAIVEKGAELDEGVVIGPHVYIGSGVRIGRNTVVKMGTVIEGDTTIGGECTIFSATIGVEPQDLKYKGEPSQVVIGNRVKIRESLLKELGKGKGKGEHGD